MGGTRSNGVLGAYKQWQTHVGSRTCAAVVTYNRSIRHHSFSIGTMWHSSLIGQCAAVYKAKKCCSFFSHILLATAKLHYSDSQITGLCRTTQLGSLSGAQEAEQLVAVKKRNEELRKWWTRDDKFIWFNCAVSGEMDRPVNREMRQWKGLEEIRSGDNWLTLMLWCVTFLFWRILFAAKREQPLSGAWDFTFHNVVALVVYMRGTFSTKIKVQSPAFVRGMSNDTVPTRQG